MSRRREDRLQQPAPGGEHARQIFENPGRLQRRPALRAVPRRASAPQTPAGQMAYAQACGGGLVHFPSRAAPTIEAAAEASLKREFAALAGEWRRGAGIYSLEEQQAMHPAYQAIIALGPDVVPLVLEDLRRTHDLWFWALRYLNHRMDVAADAGTHDDKVAAWLAWGIDRGYISDA